MINQILREEKKIKKILALVSLSALSFPAFAQGGFNPVPEPQMLSLLGLGVLAMVAIRRFKK